MSICRNPVNVISILIAHEGNEKARENEATEVLESEVKKERLQDVAERTKMEKSGRDLEVN